MQNRMLLPHPLYQKAYYYVNMSFDTEHLHDSSISAQVTCLSNCGFKKFFFFLFFFFFFSFMAHQDYFTPFEPSQLVGKTKTADPWEKHLQPNPQAELS